MPPIPVPGLNSDVYSSKHGALAIFSPQSGAHLVQMVSIDLGISALDGVTLIQTGNLDIGTVLKRRWVESQS